MEPEFEVEIPEAPDHLDADALDEWNRITLLMSNAQTISKADRAILTNYCDVWSDLRKLKKESEKEVRYIKLENGYRMKNPIFSDIASLRKELQTYAAELGITPSSRSRVKTIGKAPKTQDKKQALAEKLFKVPVNK